VWSVGVTPQGSPAVSRARSRRASWAFGLAVAGALLGGFIFPTLLSLAAVVQGFRGRREIRRHSELKGTGLATAAIVIGTVGFLLWVLLLLAGWVAAGGAGRPDTFA
jgi:hypothetical protein